MATALAHEPGPHLQDLIPPVLGCLSDPDSRVRYYACEALYNIAKAHRARILPYFNELFDSLATIAGDPDKDVRNGGELLDRLVKDIVLESPSFHVQAFIPLLKERIYTHNPFVRQFVISWIHALVWAVFPSLLPWGSARQPCLR
jgi:vacuole morphology and inheritance protein 14